ncbi:ATP-binding protein [Streptomyces sp. SBT349]|uniref:ATP-binding protein n=1 Tax=Streptomyces sp. SBT349 TaxID=1580539 RepID=UPI00066C90DF|nr:ATP-binding protein [Streptomyces sp. SBT349]
MSIWWSLQLRREAASVPLARRLLLGSMEAAGVDADISHEVSVALSEACANAVQHGTGHSGVYRVTASVQGDVCRIEVTDCGPGFEAGAAVPRSEPFDLLTSGRGMCLIEALSDAVSFDNLPGAGGAVVTFDKALRRRGERLLPTS